MISLPMLDTHQHLLERTTLQYPESDSVPAIRNLEFSDNNYASQARAVGIAGSLFMETAANDWKTEYRLGLSKVDSHFSLIRGLIVSCPAEGTEFLPWLADHSSLLNGVRRSCHNRAYGFCLSDTFVRNIQALGDLQLVFDLCFRMDQLADAYELARRCPSTTFVLDHCGLPVISGDIADYSRWQRAIAPISELANVSCKISGLPAYCSHRQNTREAITPFILESVRLFGWDRVVWGSDWPYCIQAISLGEWVSVVRDVFAAQPESLQRKLFYQNAERVYFKNRRVIQA